MRKSFFLTALLFTLLSSAFSQKKITGKVTDAATGEILSGVSDMTNTRKTTITKADGSFVLELDAASKNIIVSHVGYTMQTVDINDQSVFDISLTPAASTLEDVVVIGYGTQRKSHLTGSVSRLKNEKLDEGLFPD